MNKRLHECGIYQIKCLINNKIYLGSSKDILGRFNKHRCSLRKNIHHNRYLQKAWNKYGENNFILSVLEYCDPIDLLTREQECIDLLDSTNPKIGYNLQKIVNLPPSNARSYIITFPDGHEEIICNLKDFCLKNNLDDTCLHMVKAGLINQHKGFLCRNIETSFEELKSKMKRPEKKGRGWKGKYIIGLPDGKEITVKSLNKFCLENNLNNSNMFLVACGKAHQHKGYTCRKENVSLEDWKSLFKERNRNTVGLHYIVTYPDGTEEEIYKLNRFCKEHGLDVGTMHHVMNGRQKQHKGYKCKKLEV